MSQPNVKEQIIAGPLAGVSVAYQNKDYIADRVFPILDGADPKAKITKYLKGAWFRDEAGIRAAGTRAKRGGYPITSVSIATDEYAYAKEVTDEDRRFAKSKNAPVRFIPTHVGNTEQRPFQRFSKTVHPHTRGEHPNQVPIAEPYCGSSPHTWGTRGQGDDRVEGVRFIPTHVGNTIDNKISDIHSAVHPHTRGEHVSSGISSRRSAGSSPHTWGTQEQEGCGLRGLRFIPTHVGNTCATGTVHSARSVHPHTRGEHFPIWGHDARIPGSSPHTWGTHDCQVAKELYDRFIPTHVGNTIPSTG